jgi:hypothetical protein
MMAQDADKSPQRPTLKNSVSTQLWSHMETMHLIDAYEERWTALRRGHLKAHQWEEVAAEVGKGCTATPGTII